METNPEKKIIYPFNGECPCCFWKTGGEDYCFKLLKKLPKDIRSLVVQDKNGDEIYTIRRDGSVTETPTPNNNASPNVVRLTMP